MSHTAPTTGPSDCQPPERLRLMAGRLTPAQDQTSGRGLWLVSDRVSGAPVGQVGLLIQEVNGLPESEVGYLIHRPYWRQGLATEAARATRDWAFERLAVPRVISLIRPENIPSRGVAEKLGMRVDGRCLRATFEHLVYALARPDSR